MPPTGLTEESRLVILNKITLGEAGGGLRQDGNEAVPETFTAKRLLTPTRCDERSFFACDYNMNLYRGCNHGCIYCDSLSDCYGFQHFEQVRYKQGCIDMLCSELRVKRNAGIVGMGAASDPYNHLEAGLLLTRQALEALRRFGFGVALHTKGLLVSRDRDVLSDIGKGMTAMVSFSISTPLDGLAALLEPGAPPPSQRFEAMRSLAEAGVFTGTWLNPMLPFLTDTREQVEAVLVQTARSGGRFVMCHYGMTLRTGNREHFFAALDSHPQFAGVKARYSQAFGLAYPCPSPDAASLCTYLEQRCRELGLLFRFEEINRALRAHCPQQLSLL